MVNPVSSQLAAIEIAETSAAFLYDRRKCLGLLVVVVVIWWWYAKLMENRRNGAVKLLSNFTQFVGAPLKDVSAVGD
jgi:hypothetical protein